MSKVTVTADQDGHVIGVSENNPEYGYIRVEQITTQISDDGWLKNVRRSALIKGKVEDLAACDYEEGDQIAGKIVVRESLEPFNPENPDKNLKVAGETGIICRFDDQPIYRDTVFTTNLAATDQFIQHNNSDEIKEVGIARREIQALKTLQHLKIETGASRRKRTEAKL
jgi:hypothetical protein